MIKKEKLRITQNEREIEMIKKLTGDIFQTYGDKIENFQDLVEVFKSSMKHQEKIDDIFGVVSAIEPRIDLSDSESGKTQNLTQKPNKSPKSKPGIFTRKKKGSSANPTPRLAAKTPLNPQISQKSAQPLPFQNYQDNYQKIADTFGLDEKDAQSPGIALHFSDSYQTFLQKIQISKDLKRKRLNQKLQLIDLRKKRQMLERKSLLISHVANMANDEKTGRNKITNENISQLRATLPENYESIKKKEGKLKKLLAFNSKNLTVINSLILRLHLPESECISNAKDSVKGVGSVEDDKGKSLSGFCKKLGKLKDFVRRNLSEEEQRRFFSGAMKSEEMFGLNELKNTMYAADGWDESRPTNSAHESHWFN
jgi:hypothetical protein